MNFKLLNTLTGWVVFAIAATVYMLTAEPTGSLWDCGEFVSAAYKLEVVHPPGAPLFLMVGRMFAVAIETFTDTEATPANIAYALNVMSGLCTAFLVLFIFWSTTILGKLSLVGREKEPEDGATIMAILGGGIVAGLATTFATSVWFSAIEGEVYAMSAFFTGLVIWASLRWYVSDHPKADRWLIFCAYMIGLSIGVHLLSLLVIPFITVLYYYKNIYKPTMVAGTSGTYEGNSVPWIGTLVASAVGFGILILVQNFIIPKVPEMAANFDFVFVNEMGTGLWTGVLVFLTLLTTWIVAGLLNAQSPDNKMLQYIFWGLSVFLIVCSFFASKFFTLIFLSALVFDVMVETGRLKYRKKSPYNFQMGLVMFAMVLTGFSTYVSIVIRANADTPINMNSPGDPFTLLSYLNREQYGDRPLLWGPHFNAKQKKVIETSDVYRPVLDKDGNVFYDVVDTKKAVIYADGDYMLFPRLGHANKRAEYQNWLTVKGSKDPSMGQNIGFFFRYQIDWMYLRYFMWNFVGRQNAEQGTDGKVVKGNWISGIKFLDGARLYNQSKLTDDMENDKGRNTYYFLPLIFGLVGLFFHFTVRTKDALAIMLLFLMTGLAIIVFLNQPPREPRERDYAFAGSIFTFCIWIGLAVPALYSWLRGSLGKSVAALGGFAVVLSAPLIMGMQNWDDHSRALHTGARDYATNFLQSCAPNAILFTYGDNDTYPLWYAQEVEGIRTDVRVVNFSLLGVDWYINQLRRKINDSPAIPMQLQAKDIRGERLNFARYVGDPQNPQPPRKLSEILKDINTDRPLRQAPQIKNHVNTQTAILPVDVAAVRRNNAVSEAIPDSLIPKNITFSIKGENAEFGWGKDEIALMDIITSNAEAGWERPIYFAVTCRPEKIMGLREYLQYDGMALRIIPYKSGLQKGAYAPSQMGRIEVDTLYNNFMNKFSWGNFDKHELFVDESYTPSVQSLQSGMSRLTEYLIRASNPDPNDPLSIPMDSTTRNEYREKAVNVINRFFEVFPDMNFPLDENRLALSMINYAYILGSEDIVNDELEVIADKLAQKREFLESLSDSDRSQFLRYREGDMQNQYLMGLVLNIIKSSKNAELKAKIEGMLTPLIDEKLMQGGR